MQKASELCILFFIGSILQKLCSSRSMFRVFISLCRSVWIKLRDRVILMHGCIAPVYTMQQFSLRMKQFNISIKYVINVRLCDPMYKLCYWMWNFPIDSDCQSVGRLICWFVCHNFQKEAERFTSMLLAEHFLISSLSHEIWFYLLRI